ncbi:MAG: CpaF family protein [Planctomycetota bacterium]
MTTTGVGMDKSGDDKKKTMHRIKASVHQRLLSALNLQEVQKFPLHQLHRECSAKVDAMLAQEQYPLTGPEKQQLLREVMDDIFGLGPMEILLKDPKISDILVNGPKQVYIEREGRLSKTKVTFKDDAHLMRVIQRIATNVGRRVDESTPMLDARLDDGSRVNAIIPPLALDGPSVSIRRFGTNPIDVQKLLELESITEDMVFFLESCVQCKVNILISGGTGTGKTTLLNALSKWIPAGERVVTIEDAAELQLQRDHVVRLETRPPNIEGKGRIAQRDLVRNSLRMRPDRIVVGEVRGDEAMDMLQAMNTGHEGSMTTIHANTPRDALRRLENMVSMAGMNIPVKAIREQISSALDVLVQIGRLVGGRRKIVNVAEITGMEGETVCLNDIFRFQQQGVDQAGNAYGQFECCGVRPRLVDKLQASGIDIPVTMFQRRVMEIAAAEKEE